MTVRVERPADRVAALVMDRPGALNALSVEQLERLADAARQVAADPGISVVLLTSAVPGAFCVGADLKQRRGLDAAGLLAQRPAFVDGFAAVRAIGVPVLAAVDGYALGGGCELALSVDLILAGEAATFGLPETGLGLVPGCGGTQLLPRRVGPGRAADLIFSGRRIGAAEAYAIGLADRLVTGETAAEAGVRLAVAIAERSPVALRAAKRALREGADRPLAEALEVEDEAWRSAALSPDRVAGVEAFATRQRPDWPSWHDQDRPSRPQPEPRRPDQRRPGAGGPEGPGRGDA